LHQERALTQLCNTNSETLKRFAETEMNVTNRRAFGFWRIKYTATVVSLLAAAAVLGNVPVAAGTPALPPKQLDLRPPDLHGILSTDSPQAIPPIDAEDTPAFVIVGAPQLQEMQSHTHVPQTGIGSLYWALRHPARAWRILLPEQ
jgi:hypothetical protein